MSIEYRKEFGIEGKCRYGLREIESCKKCLFETLCRLEKNQESLNYNKTEGQEK